MSEEFIVAKDINPPKVIRELGESIAQCRFVERVYLLPVRHDPQHTRPECTCFRSGANGRVVVDVYYERNKYPLDITPHKMHGANRCVDEVASVIRKMMPSFIIEGTEEFRDTKTNILPPETTRVNIWSAEMIKGPLQKDISPPEPVYKIEDARRIPEEAPHLRMVSADIWNPRTLAAYYFLYGRLRESKDDNEERINNAFEGKIRDALKKLGKYFHATGGTIHDAVRPLRHHEIFRREEGTDWWVLKFAADVPPLSMSVHDLWNSVSRKKRKAVISVSASIPSAERSEVLERKHEAPTSSDFGGDVRVPVPDIMIPTDLEEQLRLRARIDEAIRQNAAQSIERINEECNVCMVFARAKHGEISAEIGRLGKAMSPKNARRAERVLSLLAALKNVGDDPLLNPEEKTMIGEDDGSITGALRVLQRHTPARRGEKTNAKRKNKKNKEGN